MGVRRLRERVGRHGGLGDRHVVARLVRDDVRARRGLCRPVGVGSARVFAFMPGRVQAPEIAVTGMSPSRGGWSRKAASSSRNGAARRAHRTTRTRHPSPARRTCRSRVVPPARPGRRRVVRRLCTPRRLEERAVDERRPRPGPDQHGRQRPARAGGCETLMEVPHRGQIQRRGVHPDQRSDGQPAGGRRHHREHRGIHARQLRQFEMPLGPDLLPRQQHVAGRVSEGRQHARQACRVDETSTTSVHGMDRLP